MVTKEPIWGQVTHRWQDPNAVPDAGGLWTWNHDQAEWFPTGDDWRLLPPLQVWIYVRGPAPERSASSLGYQFRTVYVPKFSCHCACVPPRKVLIDVEELAHAPVECGKCHRHFAPAGRR